MLDTRETPHRDKQYMYTEEGLNPELRNPKQQQYGIFKDRVEDEKMAHLLTDEKEPVTDMVWSLARVALPASITMVFSMLMDLVNMIFVGHLGDSAKIAGIGLGNMYVNIVSQSIIIGLNGGISTLAS